MAVFDQVLTPERLQHSAIGYGEDGKAIDGKRFAYPEMAAAGLWTTPTDLGTFFIEIAKARAGKSARIPKDIAVQMTTKVVAVGEGPDAVGLGVFLLDKNGVTYFGHNGADAGFTAEALASLDGGRAVVIMTNSENGFRIIPDIERTVFAAFGWPGAPVPIVRVALAPAQRARFNVDAAAAALRAMKDAGNEDGFINMLGMQWLARDPAKAALLMRLNVAAFPDSAGPSTASNVTVTFVDVMASGLVVTSTTGDGWSCAGMPPLCTRPELPVGPAPTLIIDARAPAQAGGVLASATVSSAATDLDPTNNGETLTTIISPT